MEILLILLFWLHMLALAVGGAAAFGIPVVGSRMASAAPEARPLLMGITKALSSNGRVAIVVLLVTGPLLLWLKYGWAAPDMTWFAVKMVLVVILLGLVIYSGIIAKKVEGGDMASAKNLPMLGVINMVVFSLLVLAATFAFA